MDSLVAVVAAVAALGISVSFGAGFASTLVSWVAINILLVASFRFVQLIGELNFAIAGFVGIGAYVSGFGTAKLDTPFILSLAAAAMFAGLVSLVFGYITLRAKGPYFMLIAFTEVIRMIYTQFDFIGGNSGMIGIFPPAYLGDYYPTFVVAVVIAMLVVLHRLEQSDFGKVLIAIRNNDAIVQSVGINVHITKVICVAIASLVAGLAGGLLAHANNVISPGDFSFLLAVYTLAYVKVGGESHLTGAVLGATVLTLLAQIALGFGPYEHIFYGAAIVIAVLTMPDGLFGIVGRFLGHGPARRLPASHH